MDNLSVKLQDEHAIVFESSSDLKKGGFLENVFKVLLIEAFWPDVFFLIF